MAENKMIEKVMSFVVRGVEYQAVVALSIICEHNYGADADGNRGSYQEFLDEYDIRELYVIDDGEAYELTDELDIVMETVSW